MPETLVTGDKTHCKFVAIGANSLAISATKPSCVPALRVGESLYYRKENTTSFFIQHSHFKVGGDSHVAISIAAISLPS